MKLSIVIPAHNEVARLPPVLEAYATFFYEKMGSEAEIILVANGCADGTAAIAEKIADGYSNIRVIDEPKKVGKGGAVILGVKAASGQYIGFVDADGATAPEEFYRLAQIAEGADGVIASRWVSGADVSIPQKGLRQLSSRAFNGVTRLLLGLKYKDTQCGAKIFKADAWNAILPQVGTTRFAFDVDLLYQLKRNGYEVAEEPTVWNDVEGSKVDVLNTSIEMFFAVVRMRLLFSRFQFMIGWYDRVLGRLMEFLLGDQLFRHTVLLFSASMVVTVCNILFLMIVMRRLSESDYALLASILALYAIFSRPLGTVATAIKRSTSILMKEGREDAVQKLLLKWLFITGGVSIPMMVLCIMFSPGIAAYFHLDRLAPIVVSAIALPAIFMSPVFVGIQHGMQEFVKYSSLVILGNLGRVLLVSICVFVFYPACGWALAGHVGSMYIYLVVSFFILFPFIRKKNPDSGRLPSLRFYMAQCFVFLLSLGVLMTADVVLVRRYLPDQTNFAYAASFGRMVTLMAGAMAAAMFPKVASDQCFTIEHRRVYCRSMMYTGAFVGTALFVCIMFPAPLFLLLRGISSPSFELIALTRWMGIIMALATMLSINFNLLLAQRRFKMLLVVLLCAVFFVLAVHFDHSSIERVMLYEGVANAVSLFVTTVGIMGYGKRPSSAANEGVSLC